MKKYLLLLIALIAVGYTYGQGPAFIPNITGLTLIAKDTNGGPTTANGDYFGISVANIGDLDKDGITDIAVGAERDDNGGSSIDCGAVYICLMNANKTVKSTIKIGKATSGIGSDIFAGDRFGSSVTGIGDLNQDGYVDIAVGAYSSDITSYTNSGAIYVICLDSTASVASYKKITRGGNGGPTSIGIASQFGYSICLLGDINHDSIPDLAVGGHAHDAPTDNGAVWVLKLRRNGTVKGSNIITNGSAGIGALADNNLFGVSVVGAGDRNYDNIPDLLVGTYADDEAYANAGCFYLLYLDTTGVADTSRKYVQPFLENMFEYTSANSFGRSISIYDVDDDGLGDFIVGANNDPGFYIMKTDTANNIVSVKKYSSNMHYGQPITGYGIGVSFAPLGDIDGDGNLELLAGGYIFDSPSLTDNGAVLILDMEAVTYKVNIGDVAGYRKYSEYSDTIASFSTNDFFGSAVCDLGDVNGDGFHDMAVGAYADNTGGTDRGAVYIVFLDSLQRKTGVQKIASGTGGFGTGLDNTDNFGISVCAPGDLDGDNIPDLIAGAHLDDDGGANRGCIWVIYLNSNGTVKGKHKISDIRGGFGGTLTNSCQFGVSVAAIGDVNNDGNNDLAVGANRDDDGGVNSDRGAVWILFMNAADSVSSYQKISDTDGDFSATFSGDNVLFGRSVCGPGDMNGDGIEDLIVGAPVMNSTGAVYILYLGTDGKVDGYNKINDNSSNFPVTLQTGKNFGISVAAVNDLDGNGIKEIFIGQDGYTSMGTDKGAVWVAFPDSLGNVYDTRLVAETGVYFNATLRTGDQFGNSVGAFTAADGSYHLLAGAIGAEDNVSAAGALFSISLTSVLSKWVAPAENYAVLKRDLDAGFYYAENAKKFRFEFDEEYFDTDDDLSYTVYNLNRSAVINSTQVQPSQTGDNRITINISSLGTGFYILEVENQKKEIFKLRFYKRGPGIAYGSAVLLGGG